jgi:quercetin dioxygenase-like cupin family protein
MHTTDTLDYVIVLEGNADLELDDGVRERVGPGDCIVQRGTRHAWRVTSDEPLVLAGILLGARRGP